MNMQPKNTIIMGNCAGVILAGGKSSRMGEDKSKLRLQGETLLQHMGQLLTNAGIENIYISHPDIIPDELPGHGPLSGIHGVLNHTTKHHSHLLFVPIDMPELTAPLLRQLIDAPKDAPLVHYASYKIPFRLSTDKQHFDLADQMLRKAQNVSLGHFQRCIGDALTLKADSQTEQAFNNLNTQDEWHAFNKRRAL